MRGSVDHQASVFISGNLKDRIPTDHPLRKVKVWADQVLQSMRRDLAKAYIDRGRPGTPPEQLLKALLLRSIYLIPSERCLMEAIEFNLLYRWFVDLPADDRADARRRARHRMRSKRYKSVNAYASASSK